LRLQSNLKQDQKTLARTMKNVGHPLGNFDASETALADHHTSVTKSQDNHHHTTYQLDLTKTVAMGHAAGLRAGTRYAFSRKHRQKVRLTHAEIDEGWK
jgi:hypothetical protein